MILIHRYCRIQPLSAQYFLWFQRMFCQSEIQHLGLIPRGDKNICRLDIAVNDALGMSRFQRIGYLYPQVKKQIKLQGLFSDALLERPAFQQLHGDKVPPINLCDLINSADVGMVQSRGSSRLTLKTLQSRRIFFQITRQEFQRDVAPQAEVFCFINHTHATAAKLVQDAVVGNSFTDHLPRGSKGKSFDGRLRSQSSQRGGTRVVSYFKQRLVSAVWKD